MQVLRAYNFMRNDCTMDAKCEHCGHIEVITSAYNDEHYRTVVVPARHCSNCGKNGKGDIKLTQPEPIDMAKYAADLLGM